MSAESFLVDLRRSLVIADPQHFPMNMEKTYQEDRPAETYPIMAYEASNVMPTPFGYKSFFDESTSLNIGNLSGQLVQEVFTYQTSALDSIQFALCEDGVYVAFATEPTPTNWAKIIDTSVGLVVGARRLWTVAVISNYVYLYQAGQPKFWAIVDPAKYAEAATPSLIVGATRTQVWTNWGAGIISYVPSFLNMAGQLGLFRADNRLGFWDSDNSIGWSSSVAIEDFKPDAKTFAGSTKFADVQGRIVKVLGSGDNFIIYATRSIVRCIGLDNSPEKWRGEAIMSEVGISFDNQVVAAQPDQIHYCITQAGICSITEGNPEYIATEVMDYIASKFPLYGLTLIEGRYLFISVNGAFPGSEYGTESVIINDWANNNFNFPRPTYPTLEENLEDYIAEYLAGREAAIQQALKDYEPIVPVDTIAPDDEILSPCFDVKIFESTWAETTFSPYTNNNEFFYSKIGSFAYDYVGPVSIEPVVTNNSITTDDVAPGDFPAEEVVTHLNNGMLAFNRNAVYQQAIADAQTDYAVDVRRTDLPPPDGYVSGTIIVQHARTLIEERSFFDVVTTEDLKVKSNECRTRLYVSNKRKVRIRSYFTGVETYSGEPRALAYYSGREWEAPYLACMAPIAYPKHFIAFPFDGVKLAEFTALWNATYGTAAPYGPVTLGRNITTLELTGYPVNAYIHWATLNYPEECTFVGMAAGIVEGYQNDSYAAKYYGPCDLRGGGTSYTDFLDQRFLLNDSSNTIWYQEYGSGTLAGSLYPSGACAGTVSSFSFRSNGIPDVCLSTYNILGPVTYGPSYSAPERSVIAADYGLPGYELHGVITHEVDYPIVSEVESIIFEMEVSGFGYYPSSGGSFRKTHSRHSSTTCPIPADGILTKPPAGITIPKLPPLDRPEVNNPPYVWEYPPAIPLPPNYALFQKGSVSPYYPTYGAAAVYDLLLQKWGTYNNSHKLVQELVPINRVDSSIMPVADKGMFAGALTTTGLCSVFKERNPASRITYGKMAFYRRGMSLATGAIAHFGEVCSGTLIVEASMDGVTVDPLLSYAVPFVNQRNVTLPFTTRAKWFNIRVEGNFNLTYLELLAESRGRR